MYKSRYSGPEIDSGIEGGLNALQGVQVNGSDLTPLNKKVNVTVPTKTSDLTNDSDFVNSTQLNNVGSSLQQDIRDVDANLQEEIDAVQSNLDTTNATVSDISGRVSTIEGKIPSAASSSNQLADKAFVNSSIATNTATFRGTANLVTDLYLTTSATRAQIAAALNSIATGADNNDYTFVQIPVSDATPTEIARIERYKFNGSAWAYEYTLNNSGFTAAQWAAINSGISAGIIPQEASSSNPLATEREIESLDSALSSLDSHVGNEVNRIDETIGEIKDVIPLDTSEINPLVNSDNLEAAIEGFVTKSPTAEEGELPVYNPDINGDLAPSGVNIEEVAKKDGYYATLTAGAAENLVGNKSVAATFLDRTTAGSADVGTGAAMLTSIKGNSIVWNQIWPSIPTISSGGITFTNNADGSYIVSGTVTAQAGYAVNNSSVNNLNVVGGHKYLIRTNDPVVKINLYGPSIFTVGSTSSKIAVASNSGSTMARLVVEVLGTSVDREIWPIIIDLTQVFGAGKEPSTVAEFESLFHLPYYANNAGAILPFAAQALKTTGVNQWDEQYESGDINASGVEVASTTNSRSSYIPVFANKEYYAFVEALIGVSGNAFILHAYDANKNHISRFKLAGQNATFTTPDNTAYIRFTAANAAFNSHIQIAIYWSGGEIPTTYHPYEEHNLTIAPATILDTNGDLIFPYGGMHGTGTAFDEMKPEADGFIHYGTRRFGKVDLGSLNWIVSNNRFNSESKVPNPPSSTNINCICTKYIANSGAVSRTVDKTICIANGGYIYIYDTAYSDAAAFKAAMSGVELIYELATPVTKELATPIPASFYENDWGTESWTPANGETPYTAPCNVEIKYPINTVDAIRNIPRGFKAPLDVVLTAFQTAGIIASYTLTYDESTQTYSCSIVKPTE